MSSVQYSTIQTALKSFHITSAVSLQLVGLLIGPWMMGAPIIQVFIFALIPLLIRKLSYCLWHSNLISVWIILSRNTIMSIVFTFVLALFYGALPDFGSALLPSFYKLKYKLSIWFPNFFELALYLCFFIPFFFYKFFISFFFFFFIKKKKKK